jgi:hypothetical protein
LEFDLYLTNETANSREFILLNEVLVNVGQSESSEKYSLSLSLQPYLKPLEELLDVSSQDSKKRVPFKMREPIMFTIEPMPTKVNFKLEFDENYDQALIGD